MRTGPILQDSVRQVERQVRQVRKKVVRSVHLEVMENSPFCVLFVLCISATSHSGYRSIESRRVDLDHGPSRAGDHQLKLAARFKTMAKIQNRGSFRSQ